MGLTPNHIMAIIKGSTNAVSKRLRSVKDPEAEVEYPCIIRLNAQKDATVPKTWQIQKTYAYKE
jgi:hypothetical protein